MDRLHLDYETASELDLKKTGGHKYSLHESTRVLMLGWAFNDEPVSLWIPHKSNMPERLKKGLLNPSIKKIAYNAQFERLITKNCLGINIPPQFWRCTMVDSFYLGFSGGLDKVLEAVGLSKKDSRGKRLINMFCKPAPSNHKEKWYYWANKPSEWEEFKEYCLMDVHVERQLFHWLRQFPLMPEWDYKQWVIDQHINDYGVPMDVDMAESAIYIWELEKDKITQDMKTATGLQKVTREPFINWISENTGVKLESTRKDYLSSLLKSGKLPEKVKPFIEMWAQKEGKASSKYRAVINGSCSDNRARGMFQYKGASRTDRVGGRLIQLQNLKRPIFGSSKLSIENVVNTIKLKNVSMMGLLYDRSVSDILGGSIRHAVCAKENHVFAICDLTSIESVILGWVVSCSTIDQTFRSGRDSYRVFASAYFKIPYEAVTKTQRSFSKPPVLGCGFMLGWRGLVKYSEGYGVSMSEDEAQNAVNTFRNMYPEIPTFWRWIDRAVKHTTRTFQTVKGYGLTVARCSRFLRISLPSGRALSYFEPEIRELNAPWSTDENPTTIENFTYMGMDDRHQWSRISAHSGGLTENIVQSIAGDILWHGIRKISEKGFNVALHVHDEIAIEVEKSSGAEALEILKQCMTDRPQWCKNMWLGADGFLTKRYTKD